MTTSIRFFGMAAYEIVNSQGLHIIMDPYLDDNEASPVRSDDLEQVDLVIVTHASFDHLGDTEKIARRTGAPVVCEPAIKTYLTAHGIAAEQIEAVMWGIAVEVAGIRIQPVECRHWSQVELPDGSLLSGVPMSYVVTVDPDVRFYHYGDTALFSDLRLIGELYNPTIGCLGITIPPEFASKLTRPGRWLSGEMTPQQGVLAAQWLGLDIVLPCHYLNPNSEDVRTFERLLEEARLRGELVPECRVMQPGESIRL